MGRGKCVLNVRGIQSCKRMVRREEKMAKKEKSQKNSVEKFSFFYINTSLLQWFNKKHCTARVVMRNNLQTR